MTLFGFFKTDPAKALRARYDRLLRETRDLQRHGNIEGLALKTAEADAVLKQLDELDRKS